MRCDAALSSSTPTPPPRRFCFSGSSELYKVAGVKTSKEKLESSSESCPGSISVNGLGFRVWCRRRLRTKDAESKATQLFWNKRSKLLTTKDLNFNFCVFLGKIETELSVAQRRRVGFRWVDGMVLLLPRMIDRLPGVWQHQSWRYLAAKAMKSASNS